MCVCMWGIRNMDSYLCRVMLHLVLNPPSQVASYPIQSGNETLSLVLFLTCCSMISDTHTAYTLTLASFSVAAYTHKEHKTNYNNSTPTVINTVKPVHVNVVSWARLSPPHVSLACETNVNGFNQNIWGGHL